MKTLAKNALDTAAAGSNLQTAADVVEQVGRQALFERLTDNPTPGLTKKSFDVVGCADHDPFGVYCEKKAERLDGAEQVNWLGIAGRQRYNRRL